jgi:hypothetical protein
VTEKEVVEGLVGALARVRGRAAQSIGWPAVVALEDQGIVLVPSWMIVTLGKLAKAGANVPEFPDSSMPVRPEEPR